MVRFFKWTPSVIDELYLDQIDHNGLYYWYQDILDHEKQLKAKET